MQKLTYTKATERLNEIMRQLENEQLDVDQLAGTLKEAKKLINFCKNQLYAVDEEIKDIIDEKEDWATKNT